MVNETIDELITQLEQLRIRETEILRQLVAARARENDIRDGSRSFRIGDHIEITNKVKSPIGRVATLGDKKGTVTKLTETRVYIRTVNGNKTWRAKHNVKHAN